MTGGTLNALAARIHLNVNCITFVHAMGGTAMPRMRAKPARIVNIAKLPKMKNFMPSDMENRLSV